MIEEIRVPHENVIDETATVAKWLVEDQSNVAANQAVVAVETSKSVIELCATAAGILKIAVAEQTEVSVGDVLAWVGDDLDALTEKYREFHAGRVNADSGSSVRISPKALALMEQSGLSRADFKGLGLVRESDVRALLGRRQGRGEMATAIQNGAATDEISGPAPAVGVPVRCEPLARTKRTEIRLLRAAYEHTLMSSITVPVRTRGLMALMAAHPELAGLFSATIVFEMARLLKLYPRFNAYYSQDQANYYEQVNVGFAMDAGMGLKVPVVRDADRKSVSEILEERREHLVAYLENRLPADALLGGTVTVTDLFHENVSHFLPVLNQGQSAILGIGSEVVAADGKSGHYNLILAFDHQLSDGREAARFLNDLRIRLEAHDRAGFGLDGAVPDAEPCCSFCLKPLSELQSIDGFMLQTVVNARGETKLLCDLCFQRW